MKTSILSAVFNESDFIDEMIDSVIAQTESHWELLFVDDGSTDDTVDRIRRRSRGDSRIALVGHGKKIGKVAAFNSAFAASTGEMVVLLAGDDRLPVDSLATRVSALRLSLENNEARAASFRLLTFSEDRKFDKLLVPKGKGGNFSGGTIALTRPLAEMIFPIPSELIAEDIWIAEVVRAVAPDVISQMDVVLEYRIHRGNSNPRQLPFDEMNESLHMRARPYHLLLQSDRYELNAEASGRLRQRIALEDSRYRGDIWTILLLGDVPWTEKLRAISSANRAAFWLRRRFYGLFSGFRAS